MVSLSYRSLVVDDEDAVRRLAVRALSKEGIACDEAADGQQALQRCKTCDYDVVVTDLRMPNRHGHALCVDLLESSHPPMIVVLTGVIEPRLAQDLMARGVDDVQFKPVDFRAFAAKVKLLLDNRQMTKSQSASTTKPSSHPAKPDVEPVSATPQDHTGAKSRPEPVRAQPKPRETPANSDNVVLMFCQNARFLQPVPERLSSASVAVEVCENSEDLYRRLRQERVDLVIIEQQLGGFLTGLDVLEKMHKDLLRPEAILIGELDDEDTKRVHQVGVEVAVPPDTEVDEIVVMANRLLAARNSSNLLVPPQARKLVDLYEDIPVLPQLLTKLLSYMSLPSEDIPLKELAEEISVDPRSTAEILKLTNSATLGVGQRVVKVLDAVNLLGPKRTITLILSSATMHAQSQLLKGWSDPLRTWYQHRSVLIGSTASVFAKGLEKISPDTAFTLGLLQDIGILVLANRGRERYIQSTLERARTIGQLQLDTLERQAYKLTHADVSAAVLDKWELPQLLKKPVFFHHRAESTEECDTTEQSFVRVMRIGEGLADLSDVSHASRRQRLNRLLAEYGNDAAETCRTCIDEALQKTTKACQLFSLPAPNEEKLNELLQNATHAESDRALPVPHESDWIQETSAESVSATSALKTCDDDEKKRL